MHIAVQINGHEQQQTVRCHLDGAGLLIGRAWNADILITDPAADGAHARLSCDDDGQIYLTDLESTNGTRIDRKTIASGALLPREAVVTVGDTTLRIFRRDDPVAPALNPGRLDRALTFLDQVPAGIVLTLLAAMSSLGFVYLATPYEFEPEHAVRELMSLGGLCLGWTALWSFISKLVQGRTHFVAFWNLGALTIVAQWLAQEAVTLLSFNLQSWTTLVASDGLIILLLMIPVYVALTLSTRLTATARWLGAALPSTLMLLLYLLPWLEPDDWRQPPSALLISRPPAFHVGAEVPVDGFLDQASRLFDVALDDIDTREQGPPSAGDDAIDAAVLAPDPRTD